MSWKRFNKQAPAPADFPIWVAIQDDGRVRLLTEMPMGGDFSNVFWRMGTHWQPATLNKPSPPPSEEREAYDRWYDDYFRKHGYPTQGDSHDDGCFRIFQAGIAYQKEKSR